MKILFCGLGSIGSRHIKNLSRVLKERGESFTIDALRRSSRKPDAEVEALVSKSYSSYDELPDDYDIAFITNPTSLHAETIAALADKTRDMFIEKAVFDRTDVDISSLGLKEDGVYYVACPLRHTPVVKRLYELCEKEKPVAIRAICSSYLPDWRKNDDYRNCYSAKKELGGGVVLDLVHEWDYLCWMLGEPRSVKRFSGQRSALEITSDDIAVYIADFGTTLLSLQLDYIGRVPTRTCEMYFNGEVVVADIINRSLTFRKADKTEQYGQEDFYINEMNYFLDCVKNRTTENMNTVKNALAVLKAATTED